MAGNKSFADRMERWRRRVVFDFGKSWWWVLLVGPVFGFLWQLIMDRVIGATNRYIDEHVSLTSIEPILLSIWASPAIHPIVVGFAVFLMAILGLLVHAYIETRPPRKTKRITNGGWERNGEGGPRILLNWDYPPEAAYGGLGIIYKILTIENSSTTDDAFDIRLDDICLSVTNRISASIEPIQRITCGHHARAKVILKGRVPEGKQGEFQMVYFAAEQLRPQFQELTEAGEPKLVRFPMVVRFKDYSGTQYRAHFEFTDDMLGYSGEGERRFRREGERHSGVKVNSSRSEATLA